MEVQDFFLAEKREWNIPDRDVFLPQPYKFLHAIRMLRAANP